MSPCVGSPAQECGPDGAVPVSGTAKPGWPGMPTIGKRTGGLKTGRRAAGVRRVNHLRAIVVIARIVGNCHDVYGSAVVLLCVSAAPAALVGTTMLCWNASVGPGTPCSNCDGFGRLPRSGQPMITVSWPLTLLSCRRVDRSLHISVAMRTRQEPLRALSGLLG